MGTGLSVTADVLRLGAEAIRPLTAVLAPGGQFASGVERLEKVRVDTGGRFDPGNSGEGWLTAGEEGEAMRHGELGEGRGMGPFLLVGRVDERKASGRSPSFRLAVPLGEARPDVPDAQPRGRRRDLWKKGQVGADGSPVLPEKDRVEPDRDPQGIAGEFGQFGELGQGFAEGGHARFDGRPTQPRDRKMEIDLVVCRKQALQPALVPEEVRKVLRPEDDRVYVLGGKIDVAGTAARTDDAGPPVAEGNGQPVGKRGNEVRAPGGADDGFQGLIPVRGKAGRRASRRGRT